MSLFRSTVIAILLAPISTLAAQAQTPAQTPSQSAAPAGSLLSEESGITQAPAAEGKPSDRASAYYNYTMGHVYEQQFENTSKPDYATQAIDFYKKAYALDPKSPVIGERLAEMYWKARREHDAITEAQEILKRDPNDVPTRRLLARIYIRSLGDLNSNGGQTEVADRAIEQYKEIYKLEPTDTESALWLARLIASATSTAKRKTSSGAFSNPIRKTSLPSNSSRSCSSTRANPAKPFRCSKT